MNVLHLFSESKLTGPARLIIDLCENLGFTSQLNLSSRLNDQLSSEINKRNIRTLQELELNKRKFISIFADAKKLSETSRRNQIQIVHCHHTHDLVVCLVAKLLNNLKTKIIFTSYHKKALKGPFIWRLAFSLIDYYITYSKNKLSLERKFHGIKNHRSAVILPGMTTPIAPATSDRTNFGFNKKDFIGVIIMRVQKYRKFDTVINAVKLLKEKIPNLKIFLLGRGTKIDELAKIPISENNLSDNITALGYRPDYLDYLKISDFFIYTSPGSDGTCRALREAMFLGKPSIVFNTGFTQDICGDSNTVILIKPNHNSLATAIYSLYKDRDLADLIGANSKSFAEENYNINNQSSKFKEIYCHVKSTRRNDKSRIA
ncbi:MAG: glycosyltransferase family 4 protein [Planctomycetes bacterium]|nr:glycosyltransferase family 4 protein [Planctomycetota bacterium]